MPSADDERRFLLDTNAYLRLADSFHPLIRTVFGKPPCSLRVIPEANQELKRNPRLAGKFHWASSEGYVADRRKRFRLDEPKREEVRRNYEFIRETAFDLGLPTSPIDMRCLAYALVLGSVVVTDDVP